ncbi:MAG: GtrA family protein [Lachnospiraceae bacterium]|nr:GtrA family protein [Lachnospiraceae bacterium]
MKKLFAKFVNRETISYGIFGVLTTLLNIFLFRFLLFVNVEYKIANLVTLVLVKLAAYICNKNFVFKSHCDNFWELCKEVLRFVFARGATALIDYSGLILLVEVAQFDKMYSKIFVTVLVIVINYVVGKKHVFKSKKDGTALEKERETR